MIKYLNTSEPDSHSEDNKKKTLSLSCKMFMEHVNCYCSNVMVHVNCWFSSPGQMSHLSHVSGFLVTETPMKCKVNYMACVDKHFFLPPRLRWRPDIEGFISLLKILWTHLIAVRVKPEGRGIIPSLLADSEVQKEFIWRENWLAQVKYPLGI